MIPKKRTIVEYALKDSNQPIGIATYSLTSQLPESYQEIIPNGEEIARKLNLLMDKNVIINRN
ncbi:PDDEXK nuclease domain-containing protein [Myroides sp. N17-2]|uniref:PDDEXK nuclease domain-containing protein n=1 Tax=Myroides sp. N17-2 TaxID=2030799 RepID=UPI000EFBBA42|nr:PDDEXK nuclease domain-containing protein [Myroides sp. N17-2]